MPVEYPDKAVSATRVPLKKRKHLQRLLDDAHTDQFDFVVTYSRDRLARDAYEHQVIRDEMHELGIPIVLASTRSLYDSGDLVIELMQDGLSQYEVEQTRVRTRDTMASRIEQGEWVGRKPPYGYKFKDGEISQVADEIIFVREIFNRYLKGEGFYRIANSLGGKWKKEKVKAIVTNPFYAGYLTAFKGRRGSHSSISDRSEWVESKKLDIIPAVITKEEWERCWNLFDQRRKGLIPPRLYNSNFLLKGLVACKDCRHEFQTLNQMTRSSTGKRYGDRYYACHCRKFQANAFEDNIIQALLDEVNRRSLVPGGTNEILNEVRDSLKNDINMMKRDIKALQKQIEETKQRMDEADVEMRNLYRDRGKKEKMLFVLQHYRLEKRADCNKWERQIEQLNTKLQFVEQIEVNNLEWDRLYADVLKGDRQALRRFLVFLIEMIVVDEDGKVEEFRARVDLR
nr:recombinase family protein [Alicyclobacillus sp. SO9]